MEGVSVGASARLHSTPTRRPRFEQQQVKLRAVVGRPEVCLVRTQRLVDFFDGVAFPGRADFRMMFQVTLIRDAQQRVQQASSLRVYRRSSPTGQELLMETLPAGVNSTTIVVSKYPIQTRDDRCFTQYRIEAFNEAGSATSTWQWTQHEFHTPRTMSTPQVRIVSATSVQLTWVASPDVQSQRMTAMQYISQNSFFYERFAWLSADASSLTLDRVIPGQRYAFAISGVNPAGIRATSVQFTMPGLSSPTVPTNLTATTNSPTTAILTWQDSDNETEYRIYRIQGSQRLLIGSTAGETTQFAATGLVPRMPYQFVVEALNELGAATATSNTVTPITIDIHGDTRSTATVLAAPATISTTIDHSDDVDTFSWRVTAGATYVFATTLTSTPATSEHLDAINQCAEPR